MIPHPEVEGPSYRVLVFDDDPSTRELLTSTLRADGYQVVVASSGDEALPQVSETLPDIILLDLEMPGINGIELCRQLHTDPETSHIPVLLITAHRRRERRLDGISAGARDFLLKPMDIADLRVRVRNACEMKRLFDQSEERFRRIAELERLRDSLVHMIIHDLKSPLTAVMGNLELMQLLPSSRMDADQIAALDGCLMGAQMMNDLVSTILEMSKLESEGITLHLAESSLLDLAEGARALLGPRAERVIVSNSPDSERVSLPLDPGLVQRVILNLSANALDHSPEEKPVVIQVSRSGELGRVTVFDQGPGVPEEFREKIFEKYQQVAGSGKQRKGSVGLGLAFCKLAVEAHGGRIGVSSPEGAGSAFWFELPLAGPRCTLPG